MKRIFLSFELLLIFVLATIVFNSCGRGVGDDEPEQTSCTVTFDTSGGTSVKSQTVERGDTVAVPADPVREGYTFVFWHLKDATAAYDFNTPVTGNITLVAKWNEILYYTVTFDIGGGTSVQSQTVEDGDTVAVPADPVREGYTFVFWHLKDATVAYDFNTPVTGNITLVAKWNEIYTVTFDSGGGTSVQSQTVEDGDTVAVPADPVREGYTFVFWHLKDATAAYDFNTPVTGNITLVAKWNEIYTVTFDSGGGTSVNPQTVEGGGKVIAPANPTRQGYTFVFWYLKGTTTAYDFNAPINSNITLVAKWNEASSVVKAEWYNGRFIAVFNPIRAVCYFRWPEVRGAKSYVLYKSSVSTGVGTFVEETSDLSLMTYEPFTNAGTYVRYYWIIATTDDGKTVRPANGGIKVTFTVTLATQIWQPSTSPYVPGRWITIGSDNVTRVVSQNPITG